MDGCMCFSMCVLRVCRLLEFVCVYFLFEKESARECVCVYVCVLGGTQRDRMRQMEPTSQDARRTYAKRIRLLNYYKDAFRARIQPAVFRKLLMGSSFASKGRTNSAINFLLHHLPFHLHLSFHVLLPPLLSILLHLRQTQASNPKQKQL